MFSKTVIVAAALVGIVAVAPAHRLVCASCADQQSGGELAVQSPSSMSKTAIRTTPANGGTRPIVF